jgi:hypothetical protein
LRLRWKCAPCRTFERDGRCKKKDDRHDDKHDDKNDH